MLQQQELQERLQEQQQVLQQQVREQQQERGLLFYRKRPGQQPTMWPTGVIFSWGIFL